MAWHDLINLVYREVRGFLSPDLPWASQAKPGWLPVHLALLAYAKTARWPFGLDKGLHLPVNACQSEWVTSVAVQDWPI
jgi:hypothetical protein